MTGLLLRDAEIGGRRRADVRIERGIITAIAPKLSRMPGEAEYDCRGGAVLPGLCDHHLHLLALAAMDRSVACGPPTVRDRAALATALGTAVPDERGWIRGVGYVETVAGELPAVVLDGMRARQPVRVQHRSGAMWMLNTAAMGAIGLASADHPGIERDGRGVPTGRLWRADAWLRGRLPRTRPHDLAAVGHRLARLGITSLTDATPDLDADALTTIGNAASRGDLPQLIHLLGAPLGASAPGPRVTIGPYKIVLADSDLPSLDDLIGRIRAAHAAARPVAVHCVTRVALVLLLAAFEASGAVPGDRVEHAALVPEELIPELARHQLRVITQPGFIADRGADYLRDVPAAEHADLYRCAGLLGGAVPVALSSDAPYGPLDPWQVMKAAVHRTVAGRPLGPAERLSPAQALAGYLAPPTDPGGAGRRIRRGAPADVLILNTPLTWALPELNAGLVRAVLMAGRPITGAGEVPG